jgi:2-phosphosulfolactate phosphatase
MPHIRRLRLLDGAKTARGLTVVIDVFRAFSTAAYAFDRGARESCWWAASTMRSR